MSYYNRVQMVLADECNRLKVNGITSWDPSDFYDEAKKFVHHIHAITLLGEDIGIRSYDDAAADMNVNLKWGIPADAHYSCIQAGLDELYDELMRND